MARWMKGRRGILAGGMVLLAAVGALAQAVRTPLPVVEVYKTPG
jgi:hypothetical protein